MPLYLFECEPCQKQYELEGSMSNPPVPFPCFSCGTLTSRIFSARVSVFKPYIDTNATGKPALIATAKQRDEYCKKHRVTYDRDRYSRALRRKPKPVVDSIELQHVKDHIQRYGPAKREAIKVDDIPTRNIDS
jgi:putative FmdB family regulatory protein